MILPEGLAAEHRLLKTCNAEALGWQLISEEFKIKKILELTQIVKLGQNLIASELEALLEVDNTVVEWHLNLSLTKVHRRHLW